MEHNIALGGFRLSDRISEIYAEKIRKELNKNSFLTKY